MVLLKRRQCLTKDGECTYISSVELYVHVIILLSWASCSAVLCHSRFPIREASTHSLKFAELTSTTHIYNICKMQFYHRAHTKLAKIRTIVRINLLLPYCNCTEYYVQNLEIYEELSSDVERLHWQKKKTLQFRVAFNIATMKFNNEILYILPRTPRKVHGTFLSFSAVVWFFHLNLFPTTFYIFHQ